MYKIGNICRKASQQLNILKRLGPYLDRLSKLTIFHTFILSNFNFCPLAYGILAQREILKKNWKSAGTSTPFCVWGLFELIRTIIRKGLGAFPTDKRQRTMALETFKIINQLTPVCLQNLVNVKKSKYSFRYNNIVDIPRVKTTTYGKKSFRYAAAEMGNCLPDHFRTESSFSQFKSLIQSWNGTECHCSACR
jgi:hypothetical protein